jgi:two-component sensor histidine kinase
MKLTRWLLICIFLPILCFGQSGKDSLRALLHTAIKDNNSADAALYLTHIAFQYYSNKQYDSALEYYYRAIRQRDAIRNTTLIASNFNDIGVIYSSRGVPDSSIHYYTKALTLYQQLNDTVHATVLEANLSIIYKDKGIYEKALEYAFNGAKRLETQEPSIALASCYSTIGLVYLKIGEYDNALYYTYKALSTRKAIGYVKGVGLSYNNLGELFISMKQYDSALVNLERSLAIKRCTGDRKALTSTLNNIGDVLLEQKKYEDARQYYSESLTISREHKNIISQTISLNNLAKLALEANDTDRAYQYLEEAEILARQSGALNEFRKNLELKVRLFNLKNDFRQAFQYAQQLLAIKDSLMTKERAESLMQMQLRYDTEKKEQQIVLLEQRQKINQAEIKTKQTFIDALIIGLCLFAIIVALVYYNSRVVRRNKEHVEMLLKELHHRVKNNLQILSSVLSLQSQQLKDVSAIQAVKSSEGRVNAMALIHKKLYTGDQNREINIKEYITELVQYLIHTYGFSQKDFNLELHLEEIRIDIDKAIPLGLIINEVVSNAFKYAYIDHENPTLTIYLQVNKDRTITISIRDNGIGFIPAAVDTASGAFGLKMVKTLTRELKGTLDIRTENGTSFCLNIPISH